MNRAQAKQILLLYRPGARDSQDPELLEAIELARHDPELESWFEQHQAFQVSMRGKLRQLQVPPHLKTSLLAAHKIVRPPVFWQQPVWIAAAAIFVFLLGIAAFLLRPSAHDRCADYREIFVSMGDSFLQMTQQIFDMREVYFVEPFYAHAILMGIFPALRVDFKLGDAVHTRFTLGHPCLPPTIWDKAAFYSSILGVLIIGRC